MKDKSCYNCPMLDDTLSQYRSYITKAQ